MNRDSEKRKEPLIVTYGQTKAILVMCVGLLIQRSPD